MGNSRSGRRRLPTAVKQIRGSRIRHETGREPAAPTGVPEMPAYLRDDPGAVAAWDRFARTLVDLKVLTVAHAAPLAVLAETWADLERLHAEWALMGRKSVLVTEWKDVEGITRHRIIANPLKRIFVRERALFVQLCGEFGITPATASKVQTQIDAETETLDAFLAARPSVLPFKKARS